MTRARVTYAALAVAALLVVVDVVIGVRLLQRRAHAAPPTPAMELRGTPVLPHRDAPSVVLVDERGRAVPLIDRASRATLVFFGYTHCRDACPIGLATIAHALARLASEGSRVRAVFVTIDPQHDTPAVLARYVARFDPRIVGLTGPRTTLAGATRGFGVSVQPTSKDIAHGDAIYLVDANRHIVAQYPPSGPPADIAADVRVIAR
jgi:protein SCO1